MKRRARPVTIGVAVLGVGVVAVFVVAHWSTVRDHVEAWWFVMTTTTRTVSPGVDDDGASSGNEHVFQKLADGLRAPVIFDPSKSVDKVSINEDLFLPSNRALLIRQFHRALGWRIIEQRFPRQAYVVLRLPQVPR